MSTWHDYPFGARAHDVIREQHTRESAAVEVVERRARRMGAGPAAIAWGCLGARNAIKAGESAHRAIEIGIVRATDGAHYGRAHYDEKSTQSDDAREASQQADREAIQRRGRSADHS